MAVLPILLGIILSAGTDASWAKAVMDFSPLKWLYEFRFLEYLLIIIPGTIAGDLLSNWLNEKNADSNDQQTAKLQPKNDRYVAIAMDKDGNPLVIHVPYLDYFVHTNIWRVNVGRIPLYLMDTDNEMNSEFDRPITHHLYGGDNENRLKQEILLGIGGIMSK